MRRWLAVAAALVLCATIASCGGGSDDDDERLQAVIVTVGNGTVLTVDVLSTSNAPAGRALVVPFQDTAIWEERADGTILRGSDGDLVPGARISVRYTTVDSSSVPPAYRATDIHVLEAS